MSVRPTYSNHIPPGTVVNIAVGILLTLVTCGIYGLIWQYKQIRALNAFLGRAEFNFAMWLLLSIVTCGIFGMYYEYKMANGINEVKQAHGRVVDTNLGLICLLLTLFGLGIVSLAIQQSEINDLCNAKADF